MAASLTESLVALHLADQMYAGRTGTAAQRRADGGALTGGVALVRANAVPYGGSVVAVVLPPTPYAAMIPLALFFGRVTNPDAFHLDITLGASVFDDVRLGEQLLNNGFPFLPQLLTASGGGVLRVTNDRGRATEPITIQMSLVGISSGNLEAVYLWMERELGAAAIPGGTRLLRGR